MLPFVNSILSTSLDEKLKKYSYRTKKIYLSTSLLTGGIPSSISNINNLQILYLDDNELTGEIPNSISSLSNLQILNLSNNQLTGEIPISISCLSKLKELCLYENRLTGEIPKSISCLTQLQKLKLDHNQLTGEIPESISRLSKLQKLYLDNNLLTGEIPNSISSLPKLQYLWLNNNQLTGGIPESLSFLTKLCELELSNNCLSPIIPECLKLNKLIMKLDKSTFLSQSNLSKEIEIETKIIQESSKKQIISCNITSDSDSNQLKIENENLKLELQNKDKQLDNKEDIIKQVTNERDYYKNIDYNRNKMVYSYLQYRDWMMSKNDINANDFTDIQLRGRGCDGIVMKASIPALNNNIFTVALKMIINIHGKSTLAHENKCANELSILPQLLQLHPNIVRILGKFISKPTKDMINYVDESTRDLCYREDGKTIRSAQFFVLQYYENTLESVINTLSETKVIKYALHLARGLLFLKESRVVHLDIKTDNLMISENDDLIIVDFGVAGKLRDDNTVDLRKTIGGNTNHLAPEVINARNNDEDLPCAKQYSWELGIILYEMLAKGEFPLDAYALSTPVKIINLELDCIPIKFHELLQKLICYKDDRISILEAWNYLETLNNN